jgi:copper(I)-binding protein
MKSLITLAALAFATATASAQVTVSDPWVRGIVAQ